ncbi:hypothetical protein [Kutzneria sp. 744]|uniref:hypothetical protein n=1 Tax=Kutzneria sp. (strain 744) TaxID=345341 RepID=UPI0003EEB367|nr:hypothetical protein [Kutzneria sp. 744]EWM14606.1 hypothetical protein KUTG_04910 [Kutzneria sp. 744]
MTLSSLIDAALFACTMSITGRYILACWLYPFKPHKRCGGTGGHRGMGGIRLCHGCDGTGRVLRLGRRLHNAYTRVRHDIRVDRRRAQDRRRELDR